jgi:uncharacterized damage-inducible protein DinB
MKPILFSLLLFAPLIAAAQQTAPPPQTLRGVLLEQIKSTHNNEEWFVPAGIAVADLTAEQARWTPPGGGHSIGQLTHHLLFWNRRELAQFKGEKPTPYNGNNDQTFTNFDSAQWAQTVKDLDQVMTDWDHAVETADDATLAKNASLIAHVSTHNAYHIGQIMYVRKLEGAWDPAKGVK